MSNSKVWAESRLLPNDHSMSLDDGRCLLIKFTELNCNFFFCAVKIKLKPLTFNNELLTI